MCVLPFLIIDKPEPSPQAPRVPPIPPIHAIHSLAVWGQIRDIATGRSGIRREIRGQNGATTVGNGHKKSPTV